MDLFDFIRQFLIFKLLIIIILITAIFIFLLFLNDLWDVERRRFISI